MRRSRVEGRVGRRGEEGRERYREGWEGRETERGRETHNEHTVLP